MITKEIKFLETLSTLIWNGMSKQDAVEMIEEHKQAIKQDRPLPIDNVSERYSKDDIMKHLDGWYVCFVNADNKYIKVSEGFKTKAIAETERKLLNARE